MPEGEKYDNIIIKLCAKVHEKYPKNNKRLSNVELYYFIEYFLKEIIIMMSKEQKNKLF